MRGAGAFGIRCGELARSRESDWLSLVKILILFLARVLRIAPQLCLVERRAWDFSCHASTALSCARARRTHSTCCAVLFRFIPNIYDKVLKVKNYER